MISQLQQRQAYSNVNYSNPRPMMMITVIMEICQAPTPRLKALNRHNRMHIEMEKYYQQFNKNEHIM